MISTLHQIFHETIIILRKIKTGSCYLNVNSIIADLSGVIFIHEKKKYNKKNRKRVVILKLLLFKDEKANI